VRKGDAHEGIVWRDVVEPLGGIDLLDGLLLLIYLARALLSRGDVRRRVVRRWVVFPLLIVLIVADHEAIAGGRRRGR
jgi:hypothetical protein